MSEMLAQMHSRVDGMLGAVSPDFPVTRPSGASSSYAQFEPIAGDHLLLKFAADLVRMQSNPGMKILLEVLKPTLLRRISADKDPHTALSALLKDVPAGAGVITLAVRFFEHAPLGIRLLMINGQSDGDLIELGRKFSFPRGCPVLWKEGEYIDFRGFYPKFDNDSKSQGEFQYGLLDGAMSLYFFKKWSGFLLHVIAFKAGDGYHWTVCSKKSASTRADAAERGMKDYIAMGRAIMERILSDSVIKELADAHLYMGGEAMAREDDFHGYITRGGEDTVVITCVGEGTFGRCDGGGDSFGGSLVSYRPSNEVLDFCRAHSLPCDTSIEARGSSEGLKRFVRAILEDRDGLRNGDFDRAVDRFTQRDEGLVTRKKGTIDHARVVGDVLEGFVFNIVYADGGRKTVKVKLPHYTWRTFFLRPVIASSRDDPDRFAGFVSEATRHRMARVAGIWMVSESGKARFTLMMKAAAVLLKEGQLGDEPSLHVRVADEVTRIADADMARITALANDFDAMLSRFASDSDVPVSVCLIVGPIGSGKSTTMRRLQRLRPDRFECVDGDLIAGGATEKLGPERNAMTLARVWETILRGKVPIISQGGGIFTVWEGEDLVCSLKQRIQKIFRRDTHLVALVMAPDPSVSTLSETPLAKAGRAEFLERVYDTSEEYMHAVHARRVEQYQAAKGDDTVPAWTASMSVSDLNTRSKGNRAHAAAVVESAKHIFAVPYDPAAHLASLEGVKGLEAVAALLTPIPAGLKVGYFDQVRLVVAEAGLEKARHITLEYVKRDQAPLELGGADIRGYLTRAQAWAEGGALLPATRYTLKLGDKPKDWKPITLGVLTQTRDSETEAAAVAGPVVVANAHVTEESGAFAPAAMGQAAEFILNRWDTEGAVLELATKQNVRLAFRPTPAHVVVTERNGREIPTNIPANYETAAISYTILGVAAFAHEDDAFSMPPKGVMGGAKKKK